MLSKKAEKTKIEEFKRWTESKRDVWREILLQKLICYKTSLIENLMRCKNIDSHCNTSYKFFRSKYGAL